MNSTKIDPDCYREWNIDDVGNWIDSIENGKFSEYTETMTNAMKEHNLMAADIKKLNPLALKLMDVAADDETIRNELSEHCKNIGTGDTYIYLDLVSRVKSLFYKFKQSYKLG